MRTDSQVTFKELYDACLYSSIAHAVSNIKNPLFAYAQSWDGINYSFNYGSSRGTITFDLPNRILVGAIRDEKSERISWYPTFKAIGLFNEAPDSAKVLSANEALEYLLDEINGIIAPVITTAFWSEGDGNEGDHIIICDSMDDFLANGGEFIANILVPMPELCAYWEEQYQLTVQELEIVDNLFQLKKNGIKRVNDINSKLVVAECAGYGEFIESLTEIGFEIEG